MKKSWATGIIISIIAFSAGSVVTFLNLQQGSPPALAASVPRQIQELAVLEKFKVSGLRPDSEFTFLRVDAGMERGIWTKYGLAPDFVIKLGGRILAANIKEDVASGIMIGTANPSEVLLARSTGVPVKIVAGVYGESNAWFFAKVDAPIFSLKDLDGKKVGVVSMKDASYRTVLYMNDKLAIKAEPVAAGNDTGQIVALKLGKIDAIDSSSTVFLRLVDAGELKIVGRVAEIIPTPYTTIAIWATEEGIQREPTLVKKFVSAYLDCIKYLKENPIHAADIYVNRTNAPRDLADKAMPVMNWTPSGRGSGQDLVAAVANIWEVLKVTGQVPSDINPQIVDAVDVRFLP